MCVWAESFEWRASAPRKAGGGGGGPSPFPPPPPPPHQPCFASPFRRCSWVDRERVGGGKRVDVGGRRFIKKKKDTISMQKYHCSLNPVVMECPIILLIF